MPSRSRTRERTLQPVALDDLFVEVVEIDYGESDLEGSEAEEEEEGSDDDGASEEEENGEASSSDDEEDDEQEQEQFVEGRPSARARVSPVAAAGAAAETAATPTCPVCMDPWTSQGPHRISCIPCGHVYGRSCLERWLTERGNRSATCPQCSKRFKHKDIINLYAPEVAIPKNELEKEVSYLRERNDSLEKKVLHHDKLFEEMTKRQIVLEQGIIDAVSLKRQKVAEPSDRAVHLEPSTSATVSFSSQIELVLDGARVIAIDASNQTILASGRAGAVGAEHVITKIDMISNHQPCTIRLPLDTKAVRDICILPGSYAIFTSVGRKLSLFSMRTDSVVLQCDLPNGMLMVFDVRQTIRPLHCLVGLPKNPIHTLHSVIDNNGCRKILSASAVGPCMWDADDNQSRPQLLTEMDSQRVCISLACAPQSGDVLVASFRPKVEASEDGTASQVYLSQTPSQPVGSGKLGHHALVRRTGNASFTEGPTCYANVSEVRMSKSAMIPYGDSQHLFAYGMSRCVGSGPGNYLRLLFMLIFPRTGSRSLI